MEAAFYEAWEDAGLADEAPPRAKGSRPSSQKKRKVVPASTVVHPSTFSQVLQLLVFELQRRCKHYSVVV